MDSKEQPNENSHAQNTSVPPEDEPICNFLPNASCVHSIKGAVITAPVTVISRRASKDAISTIKLISVNSSGYNLTIRGLIFLIWTSVRKRGLVPNTVTLKEFSY